MNERDITRQSDDPTAKAALSNSFREPTSVVMSEPRSVSYLQRARALTTLNSVFPNEARKRPIFRNRHYRWALDEIACGNFDAVNRFIRTEDVVSIPTSTPTDKPI